MAHMDVDAANQMVSDLIGLIVCVGCLLDDLGAPALALIGHGLAAAGNPVAEWQGAGAVPDEFAYIPLFAHAVPDPAC